MKISTEFKTPSEALWYLSDLLRRAPEVGSRGGARVRERTMVGVSILCPEKRYLTNPNRKANVAAQIAETMWVLAGRNDLDFLNHYLPRAKDFSDDGISWRAGYGPRLRSWGREGVDQLRAVVDLLQKDPTTRRATMSIYDPGTDFGDWKDVPCNNWIDFKNRLGKLDLHVAIRSNDLIWGWSGINQFEWSALQEIVAALVGVELGETHYSISSLHIYDRHWEKAAKIAEGEPNPNAYTSASSPRFTPREKTVEYLDSLLGEWFDLEAQIRTRSISDPEIRDAIERFPEPMFWSWLSVIAWWWTSDPSFLDPLKGTEIYFAAIAGLQPPFKALTPRARSLRDEFEAYVGDLHEKKNAAYGDSWKRRGEQVGILANIARKVDRLGKSDEIETAADTAIDLLVYLLKYRWWLFDEKRAGAPYAIGDAWNLSEDDRIRTYLAWLGRSDREEFFEDEVEFLQQNFEALVFNPGVLHLNPMIGMANALARREFWKLKNAKRSWKGYGDGDDA